MNKCYLAYFDILGYGSKIMGKDLSEECQIYKGFIEDAKICCNNFIAGKGDKKVFYLYFSDTHFFYTEDDSEIAFASIIGCSLCFMLLASVRRVPYLPVRGAITYGDFKADLENNIFIGSALRKAYFLEKNQEWSGCALSLDCVEKVEDFPYFKRFVEERLLVEYKIPMKKTKKYNSYVINMEAFPRLHGEESRDIPITNSDFWRNIFENKGENNKDTIKLDGEAEKKLEHIQEFFQYIESIKKTI